jgi:hypothetical protein
MGKNKGHVRGMSHAAVAVAKFLDRFAKAVWGTPERRFDGSALSEAREVPQTVSHPNRTLLMATAISNGYGEQ